MTNILLVFGTRPEAIKMSPLVNELKKNADFNVKVCVTGQHKEMLYQVLKIFDITPDFDLKIMKPNQTLSEITISILEKIGAVFEEFQPNLVLVHGDTTTTFATSLSAFYHGIKVGHVEAGLRTYNVLSPFPEEFNRQAVSIISDFNFAPTEMAKLNLIKEGKESNRIFVTGNTAIDALKTTVISDYAHPLLDWVGESKLILLTAHRRENLGIPMRNMFNAIKRVLDEDESIKVIYPIHKNPTVRKIAESVFGENERIRIIEPLDVIDFHNFLNRSYIILTDSGGIQEEAPSLGKPVLVLRETTERPEGVMAGTLKLVGISESNIYNEFKRLLTDKESYLAMSKASNPYGDGQASKYIADIIHSYYNRS